jgi:hypothetical protein
VVAEDLEESFTLAEFIALGSFDQQDKRYRYRATNFSWAEQDSAQINISTVLNVGGIPGNDVHTVEIGYLSTIINSDGDSRFFAYDIEILSPPAAPGTVFGTIAVDSTVDTTDGGTLLTKTVREGGQAGAVVGTSSSVNGIPGASITCNRCTLLGVRDDMSSTDGIILSVTNTFRQVSPGVPEPASLGLLGFGGQGVVGLRSAMGRERPVLAVGAVQRAECLTHATTMRRTVPLPAGPSPPSTMRGCPVCTGCTCGRLGIASSRTAP